MKRATLMQSSSLFLLMSNCIHLHTATHKWKINIDILATEPIEIDLHVSFSINNFAILSNIIYFICQLFCMTETWTLYRWHIKRLNILHKGCLHTICDLTFDDRGSNAYIFEKCNIGTIESFIMQSQLRRAEHVAWMTDDRLPKVIFLQWTPWGS